MEASKYLSTLSFSFDGHDEHSSVIRRNSDFLPMIDKIRKLKSEGANVEITFTLHKQNIDFMGKMRNLAAELGVPHHFSFLSTKEFGLHKSLLLPDENDVLKISSEIRNSNVYSVARGLKCSVTCGLGFAVVSVASNGDVFPCAFFNGEMDFCMGNVFDKSIWDILANDRNIFGKLGVDDYNNCKDCHVKYMCGGGCRFRGYAKRGNCLDTDTIVCNERIRSIENAVKELLG
jgi:radical SAM protein with 4Fe4S-binding SPASM domain